VSGAAYTSGMAAVLAASLGLPRPGEWQACASAGAVTANTQGGQGFMRAAPWLVPMSAEADALAVEVAGSGEAGAVLRLGLYLSDERHSYPGALLIDAGTVPADVGGYQTIALPSGFVVPAGLLWTVAVPQLCPTTPPSVRAVLNVGNPQLSWGASLPSAAGTSLGYIATGVTDALPATFPPGIGAAQTPPRLLVRWAGA